MCLTLVFGKLLYQAYDKLNYLLTFESSGGMACCPLTKFGLLNLKLKSGFSCVLLASTVYMSNH